ncbi:MAG: VTT domain-containing protein [Candidatus Moranbacteria bacterium]|nr:VTT domain-containing protein [Candidatus Moranbacteria bacterium]
MELFNKKNIAIAVSLTFISFLVWSSIAFQNFFAKIVPYFQRLTGEYAILSVLVFIALGVLSTMISSFISLPLVPVAVLVWGNTFTALYLGIGWLAGDILSYFIGYYAGNSLVRKFLPYEEIQFYLKKIPPNAEFGMILLFILSMPAEIPGYTIGALRYKFTKYVAAQTLNEIFYSILVVYAFAALVEKNNILFFVYLAFGIALFGYMFFLFQKKMKKTPVR